ncbi:hypothetical protein [Microbaculum sp. FT89]|uniref:hypothetical protein n=1 Tax=Microbaculum sp. FT89 TaxID=3447298 RepID=UPI003F52DD0C
MAARTYVVVFFTLALGEYPITQSGQRPNPASVGFGWARRVSAVAESAGAGAAAFFRK